MFSNPRNWFPDLFFANAFAYLVILMAIVDFALPRILERQRPGGPAVARDRGSFAFIYAAAFLSVAIGIAFRAWNWGIALGLYQYIGLCIIVPGLVVRNWAIIKLGRLFSRTVTIEQGHHLIVDGPYRWLRHPAYTGMLLMYAGINLALGTWLGAIVGPAILLSATIYRIRVEEKTLLEAFGGEYGEYMQRTWRLMPGW